LTELRVYDNIKLVYFVHNIKILKNMKKIFFIICFLVVVAILATSCRMNTSCGATKKHAKAAYRMVGGH